MAVVKHSHSGRFNKAFLWVKGQYSYRLRCGEAPDQERGGAVWEFRTKMADYGHTKGWGSSQGPISWLTPRPWPPARWWTQADPACTDPPPITNPRLPELVLIATHVSYQGARVLMEAEGREGESEGDHSGSQSNWLLMDAGEWRQKGAGLTPLVPMQCEKKVRKYMKFSLFYGISGISLRF